MVTPASFLPALSSWQMAQLRLSWPWRRCQIAAPCSRNGVSRGSSRRSDRHAARLVGDEGRQRQQVPAFRRQGLGLLVGGAAEPDAALEIDRLVAVLGHRGIARRDTLHVGDGMAVGARLVGGARGLGPELLAELDEQHAGIGGVVVLHLLQGRAHVLVARAALVGAGPIGACLGQGEGRGEDHRQQHQGQPPAQKVTQRQWRRTLRRRSLRRRSSGT